MRKSKAKFQRFSAERCSYIAKFGYCHNNVKFRLYHVTVVEANHQVCGPADIVCSSVQLAHYIYHLVLVYLLIKHLYNMLVEIQESRTHKAHIVHQQRPSITKQ